MGKTYNLYLNSTRALNYVAANQNDLYYNVNWSFLPDNKKFNVSFSFASQNITNLTANDLTVLMAYFDNNNTYVAQSSGLINGVANAVGSGKYCLGLLFPSSNTIGGVAKNLLTSGICDQQPIMLTSRSYNANLRIELQSTADATTSFSFDGNYVLIIRFEEVDE